MLAVGRENGTIDLCTWIDASQTKLAMTPEYEGPVIVTDGRSHTKRRTLVPQGWIVERVSFFCDTSITYAT